MSLQNIKGTIFDIKKFSIHDGRGIRTTVFLKGCPLNCFWCHNPESKFESPEIMYYENRCGKCFKCVDSCEKKALKKNNNKIIYLKEKCINCKKCIENCPNEALKMIGKKVSVNYIIKKVKKDMIFYEESGGGVTLSGGEPLNQLNFVFNILKRLKRLGISTAIDTSGFTTKKNIIKIDQYVDEFLYDFKFFSEKKHKKYTGVSNKLIKNNLKLLSNRDSSITIRYPLLPGFNDNEKELNNMVDFFKKLEITNISILPYHKAGRDKYKRIFEESFNKIEEPDDKKINKIKNKFINEGFIANIYG